MRYIAPADAANAETFRARLQALYPLIAAEVEGLTQPQLDLASDRWRWGQWSIRQQVAHMALVFFGWLYNRWGEQLFPAGAPSWYRDVEAFSPQDRWQQFGQGDAAALLAKIRRGVDLALEVLSHETPESMRGKQITVEIGRGWVNMAKAHATGVTEDRAKPGLYHLTLEGTLRHIYYENLTHLYNVQRLKLAQGLPTRVDLPFEGYHALEMWDRSEP